MQVVSKLVEQRILARCRQRLVFIEENSAGLYRRAQLAKCAAAHILYL